MITNILTPSSQVPVILVIFQRNLNFLIAFSKTTQTSNFIKIRPEVRVAALFHADRDTDTTMLAVAFRNFVNAPKTRHIT